ncbi:uncharacterized protein LOC144601361 [Rhinoraja longicauda]
MPSGSYGQSVSQSPTEVTLHECQSLSITCRFKATFWGNYDFQTGYFYKRTKRVADWQLITSERRFVVTTNKAENVFRLDIRDLKVEDSSTYYCKAKYKWDDMAAGRYWSTYYKDGTGTTVTVTGDSISPASQSPPRQFSMPGDNVSLNCEYSGFCPYTVHWYRQFPGQAPKFLLQRHTSGKQDKEKASGVRISGSLDPGKKVCRLTISKVQPSDAAVYHCGLSRRIAQSLQ